KPVLIMQGSEDCQVKADVDFVAYQELLAGKDNVSFRLYEGLNHCFVPVVYGGLSKASKDYGVERHIGEEVIEDVARWILGA
ncbi:MAG: hypothetical protein IKV48_05645, partial [Eggerthellaceae bacterium]|nr:hypothetical protein [Eggerthellaceae bacterium]